MTGPSAPFSEIASAVPSWGGPSWLSDARKSAVARFVSAGLPTTRIEAWRTTPLPDLGKMAYAPGSASTANQAGALVKPFMASDVVTLVFVDGFHSETLSSSVATWPKGVRLAPMSRQLVVSPEDLQPWFADMGATDGALHDLNTAAFRDGAWVVVDDGVQVQMEVRVVLVSTSTDQPVAQHVRSLVQLGRGASLRMMVAVIGAREARGFTNSHTTITMAERSRLDLVRVHESPPGVPHFDALSATLGAHSVLGDTVLQTGPSWTRSEIDIVLNGERATADLGGVFIARGTQVSDIHTLLSHQAPGVISRQNYRGLAADEARGVFHGQIKVESEARGTDATQNNKNMLLSKRASVHSTPALEILTDDVKCKHGSATGQIDQAQLFYLRSRGIDSVDAIRILTRAFASEIVSRLSDESTRRLIEAQIAPSLEQLGVAA
ncbi:MAG: SufD family Fe-S cluster assembly protein [Vicinamibacteria bacterium]|nr:SufD family Fe-S cluster assembly protein [Vicinamibacteria bacterium]